jgi:hypothetical protein
MMLQPGQACSMQWITASSRMGFWEGVFVYSALYTVARCRPHRCTVTSGFCVLVTLVKFSAGLLIHLTIRVDIALVYSTD